MNGSLPLPPILSSKLSDFRRRVWMVKLAEGTLAAIFGLAISYLLVLALDRFFDTPGWLRGIILAIGAAIPGLGLPLKWHKWVWKQRQLEDAARLLRWKFPRLGDQLLGIVELARHDHVTGRSERLVQAAMIQADEAVQAEDFRDAVPRARHRQWALAAVGVTALIVAGFITINEAARNALSRWLMPWRDTARFTFARIDPLPNPLIVPFAENFTLPVKLAADSRSQPKKATGQMAGQPGISVARVDGLYALNFPPQKTDADLFLVVGDVRQTLRVEPRPRPELTALQIRLQLPTYLKYKTEPMIDVRGGAVSVLGGSVARFEATASRSLARAEMDGKVTRMDGDRLLTEPSLIEKDREVTFTWQDTLGLSARVPLVLQVKTAQDEAPKLVARRETLEQVVLESEVVTFDLTASDDFGLKQVGLTWTGLTDGTDASAAKTHGSKVAASGAPEMKAMETRATFCAAREGIAPQSIEVRAWAEDYLPDRERSRSAAFLLHILNKTDHALWVTQQMGKWLAAAKETYEREQQLHQTNKELRALSAAELDRTENRRKVAKQSSAENANAERLSSLNTAGKHLVEQATKNSEFDAPRLESWATMLQSLEDIAKTRMPNVADLLKQSADAKSDASMAQNPQNSQNPQGESNSNPSTNPNSASPPPTGVGKLGKPADGKSAPQIAAGESPPPSIADPPLPTDPNAKPVEKAPSIKLTESTMSKPETSESKAAPPKPPSPGMLQLPSNSLAAAPGKKTGEEPPMPPDSSAQKPLDQGVLAQKDLLAEFAKVSDQLSEILSSLEASTFVKRFKAASREQTQLAGNIGQKTLDAFGIERDRAKPVMVETDDGGVTKEVVDAKIGGFIKNLFGGKKNSPEKPQPTIEAEPVPEAAFVTTYAPVASSKAKDQSGIVKIIQSDLEAYFQRKPDQHFKRVLGEMKKTQVIKELKEVGVRAGNNMSGNAIHGAEYWADTMDRWAEEMVKAGKCSNCSKCSADSLPPEIVLKVMQALRDELKLRDETRELDNAEESIGPQDFTSRSSKLSDEQERIGKHTESAVADIIAIPEGEQKFGKELSLLTVVVKVMDEAAGILESPDAGPRAIAAETEAIELLLQTKRQNPKSGGGGGSDPGGGGRAASASSAALADLGPGNDANSAVSARPVGQATGRAGREFPEEFRAGLDAYFSNLEGTGGPR